MKVFFDKTLVNIFHIIAWVYDFFYGTFHQKLLNKFKQEINGTNNEKSILSFTETISCLKIVVKENNTIMLIYKNFC